MEIEDEDRPAQFRLYGAVAVVVSLSLLYVVTGVAWLERGIYLAASLAVVAVAVRLWVIGSPGGRAWRLFAVGGAAIAAGNLAWDVSVSAGGDPAGGLADVLYVLGYLLVVVGLVRLAQLRLPTLWREVSLDAAMVAVVVATLVWVVLVVRPSGGAVTAGQIAAMLLAGLSAAQAHVVFRLVVGRRASRAGWLLLGSFGFRLVGDLAYAALAAFAVHKAGGLLDLTWIGAKGLFVLALLHPSIVGFADRQPSRHEPGAAAGTWPLGVVLLVGPAAILLVPDHDLMDRVVIATTATVLAGLALARTRSANRRTLAISGQLVRERRRARLFREMADDLLLLTDTDGTILSGRAGPGTWLGSAQALSGKYVVELVHPEDRPVVAAMLTRLADGGLHEQIEVRAVVPGGGVRWVRTVASVFDSDESPQLAWTLRDIDELHRKEQALAESEERYRGLFTGSASVMLVIDPSTGEIVDANTAAARFYGYPLSRLRQMSIGDINCLSRQEIAAEMDRARTLERTVFEFRHRLADGRVRDVDVYSGPVTTKGPPLLYSIVHDVTERHRMARELARSEETFRLLTEDAEDVVYRASYTPGIAVDYISPSAATVLGIAPSELKARPRLLVDHIHPDDQVLWLDDHIAEPAVVQARWQRPDGTWVWIEDHAAPIFEHGVLVGRHGIIRDVSTRHRTAVALREALASEEAAINELRRLQLLKHTFLRAISHELRTPLTVIGGVAETLSRYTDDLDGPVARQLVGSLQRHTGRLSELLDDLIDINQLTQASATIKRAPVLVAGVVAAAAAEVDLSQHRFRVGGCTTSAELDRALAQRLVVDLLNNAVRHTPPGTTITVRCHSQDDGVNITVADDGPGLPESLWGTIFEPFVQGPQATTSPAPGTGIGLAIVRRIAELHGGRVWVDHADEGGAAFHVWLPAGPQPLPIDSESHQIAEIDTTPPPKGFPRD